MNTKKQINELFELRTKYVNNYDDKIKIKYSELYFNFLQKLACEKNKNSKEYSVLYCDIVKQIRDCGMYKYFQEKGLENEENFNFFVEMIQDTDLTVSEVEQYLNTRIITFKNRGLLVFLITATKDLDFIKDCIFENNGRKTKLNDNLKVQMINRATNIKEDDSKELRKQKFQFVKNCIYESEIAKNKKLKLNNEDICYLILKIGELQGYNSNEIINEKIQFVEDFIFGNESKKIKLGNMVKKTLISEIGHMLETDSVELRKQKIQFVKDCLFTNKEKEFNLGSVNIREIIEYVGKIELGDSEELKAEKIQFIKNFIEEPEIGLDSIDTAYLIKNIGDAEYAKKCLFDEKIKLDSSSKTDLIKSIKDSEFTKRCIIDSKYQKKLQLNISDVIRLIASVKEDFIELKNKKIEILEKCKNGEIKLEDNDIVYLIESIGDLNYAKKYLSKEYQQRFKLGSIYMARLIKKIGSLKDIDTQEQKEEKIRFIKDCLFNDDIILDGFNICCLISIVRDLEFAKKCLSTKKEFNDDIYKSSKFKLQEIIQQLEFEETIKESVEKEVNSGKYTSFELDGKITIGIEIESEGDRSEVLRDLYRLSTIRSDNTERIWESKLDGTLKNGVEVTSPILKDNKEDIKDIYRACSILKQCNQKVSEHCGGHIHIGANYLKSKEAYINLLEIWGNTEKLMYIISNEKGELPRTDVVFFAYSISPKLNKELEHGSVNLEDESDLDKFIANLKDVQASKFSALNFLNINNAKNTIEFRVPNGTLNADTWIENIKLFGKIVQVSQELAELENLSELNEQQKRMIELKDRLTEEISQEEKLEVLLELLFSEENRNVYRERYKVNSKLLQESFQGKEFLKKIDFKKVKFKKHKKDEFGQIAKTKLQTEKNDNHNEEHFERNNNAGVTLGEVNEIIEETIRDVNGQQEITNNGINNK